MGQVSDALHDSGVPGFDETNLSNDWGRIILEAAGTAAVAGVTGGNVGAAAGLGIFVAGEGKLIVKGGVLTAEEAGKWFAHSETDANGNLIVYAEKNCAESGGSSSKVTVEESHGTVEGNVSKDTPTGSSEIPNINMDHILNGEVKTNKNGTKRSSGGHLLDNPDIKVTEWTGAADKNGVTEGKISVRDPATGEWVPKGPTTTFFPESWDKSKAASEIQSAFANAKPTNVQGQWKGISSSGIEIRGYYNKDGSASTAYPVYEGVKK